MWLWSALHATEPRKPWAATPEAAALGDSHGSVIGSVCYGGGGEGHKPSRTSAWSRTAMGMEEVEDTVTEGRGGAR